MSKEKKNGKQNPVTLEQQHWGALVHICSLKFSFQFFLSKKEKKKVLFPIWGENILVSPGRKHPGLTSFFFPPLPSTKHPQKKFSLILSLSLSLSLSKIHPTKYTLNVTLKNPSNLEKDTFLSISSLQSDQEIASLFCNHTLLSFLPIGLKQTKQWAKNFVPISNFIVCESNVHYPL